MQIKTDSSKKQILPLKADYHQERKERLLLYFFGYKTDFFPSKTNPKI